MLILTIEYKTTEVVKKNVVAMLTFFRFNVLEVSKGSKLCSM